MVSNSGRQGIKYFTLRPSQPIDFLNNGLLKRSIVMKTRGALSPHNLDELMLLIFLNVHRERDKSSKKGSKAIHNIPLDADQTFGKHFPLSLGPI